MNKQVATTPVRAVRYLRHNVPASVAPGSFWRVGVVLENRGSGIWFRESESGNCTNFIVYLNDDLLKCEKLTQNVVPPGKRVVAFFDFIAPTESDSYILKFDMVEQNVSIFSDEGSGPFILPVKVSGDRNQFWSIIYSRLFGFYYSRIPLMILRCNWRIHQLTYRFWLGSRRAPKRMLGSWKTINRRLADMECDRREQRVVSLPPRIIVDISTKCNLKCAYCFRQHLDFDLNSIPDPPKELIDAIIECFFPTAKVVNFGLIGEPLLSPHLNHILDAMYRFGVKLNLITNGTLLHQQDLVERLAPLLEHLEVSVDSCRPDCFQRFRRGARLDKVLANVDLWGHIRKSLAPSGFDLGFSVTLMRENMEELPELIKLISRLGGNFVRASFGVVFRKDDVHQSVMNEPQLYNEVYVQSQRTAEASKIHLSMPMPFMDKETPAGSTYCSFCYHVMRLNHEGFHTACLHEEPPFSNKWEPGKKRSSWNSANMKKLRATYDTANGPPSCRDCYVLCGGNSLEARKKIFLRIPQEDSLSAEIPYAQST